MRLYLSYPITKATPKDLEMVDLARKGLRQARIDFYDPAKMEPRGYLIEQLQDWDVRRMRECDAVLTVWSDGAAESRGVNAELEWASRLFRIPIFVWKISARPIEPWPTATILRTGGTIGSLSKLLEAIHVQFRYDSVKPRQANRRSRTKTRQRQTLARSPAVAGVD